jgi:hypothetical protein
MNRRSLSWTIAAMAISLLLVAAASVWYTNHVAEQSAADERASDRRWCTVLIRIDEAYKLTPPATEAGRNVAVAFAALRRELGCGP